MAHMIRGSGNMSTKPPGPQGTGMVVGAIVNKPHHHQPMSQNYGMTVNPATTVQTSMNSQGITLQGQMAPGLLSIKQEPVHQSSRSSVPQNLSISDGIIANQLFNNMANTKEKTPMCLVNELARYNKIQHQYTLTDEQGPAHKKTFFVKLKLGQSEEYSASGPSIKKAQHAAAEIALEKTQLKKPPPKPTKTAIVKGGNSRMQSDVGVLGSADSITPTVELNSLAMKRGEPAVYRPIDMPRPQHPPPNYYGQQPPGMSPYNQRFNYPKYPRIFYVSLKVGQREFIGEGATRQAARHNAAEKALTVLRALPLPEIAEPEEPKAEPVETLKANAGVGPDGDGLKSEISLVHEIALKRNMTVNFEVIRESGPPHMRTFVTRCLCGDIIVEGEGNSKKLSKKRAAEKMLDKLQGLSPLPPSAVKLKKSSQNKKKNRNLVKLTTTEQVQKTAPEYGVGINPISRLIQIQQAKKEKEPVYSLVTERGLPRRREFVMQVTVGEQVCTGVGPNKKLAKRNAAEAMLQLLGYSRPSPQPGKPAIKTEGGTSPGSALGDKKVTFIDQDSGQTRQLVPGVLLMPADHTVRQVGGIVGMPTNQGAYGHIPQHQPPHHGALGGGHGGHMQPQSVYSPQTTAAIAKELLDTGSSPTAESIRRPVPGMGAGQMPEVRPKQQLQYLADVLGFKIQYTDFPKGNNKTEYLSLVSLSTNPPQVSHGAGLTLEQSHDMAALTALRALSEMGLDTVKVKPDMGGGDGHHVKGVKLMKK